MTCSDVLMINQRKALVSMGNVGFQCSNNVIKKAAALFSNLIEPTKSKQKSSSSPNVLYFHPLSMFVIINFCAFKYETYLLIVVKTL